MHSDLSTEFASSNSPLIGPNLSQPLFASIFSNAWKLILNGPFSGASASWNSHQSFRMPFLRLLGIFRAAMWCSLWYVSIGCWRHDVADRTKGCPKSFRKLWAKFDRKVLTPVLSIAWIRVKGEVDEIISCFSVWQRLRQILKLTVLCCTCSLYYLVVGTF